MKIARVITLLAALVLALPMSVPIAVAAAPTPQIAIKSLPNIAALKTLGSSLLQDGTSYQVLGYYAANDGGGGTYVWNSTSTATDNGGTVIQATGVATGRWLLKYSGSINVRWFGAKGNGSNDDSSSIQACIDSLPINGGSIVVPYCETPYIIGTGLTITKNVVIDGESSNGGVTRSTVLQYTPTTGVLFTCSGNSSVTIQNISLKTTTAVSSVAITMASCQDNGIYRTEINGFFGGIRLTGNGSTTRTSRTHIRDVLVESIANLSGAYGLYLDHASDTYANNFQVFCRTGTTDNAAVGIILDTGVDGLYVDNANIAAGLNSMVIRNTLPGYVGVYDGPPANSYFTTVLFDSPTSDAVVVNDCERLSFVTCWFSGAGLKGNGTYNSTGTGLNILGGSDIKAIGGFANSNALHGVNINTSGSSIDIIGITANDNNQGATTGDGVHITSGSNVKVLYGTMAGAFQKYGVNQASVTESIQIEGNNAYDNATGAINFTGATTYGTVRGNLRYPSDSFAGLTDFRAQLSGSDRQFLFSSASSGSWLSLINSSSRFAFVGKGLNLFNFGPGGIAFNTGSPSALLTLVRDAVSTAYTDYASIQEADGSNKLEIESRNTAKVVIGTPNVTAFGLKCAGVDVLLFDATTQKTTWATAKIPVYANNAAALAGGLTSGDMYRTGGDPDTLCIVH